MFFTQPMGTFVRIPELEEDDDEFVPPPSSMADEGRVAYYVDCIRRGLRPIIFAVRVHAGDL